MAKKPQKDPREQPPEKVEQMIFIEPGEEAPGPKIITEDGETLTPAEYAEKYGDRDAAQVTEGDDDNDEDE